MYRGTTPTIVLNVTGENFTGDTVYVTLQQENHKITKTGSDLNIIPDGHGLHHTLQVMIPILTFSKHIQRQIDLGIRLFGMRHAASLPFRFYAFIITDGAPYCKVVPFFCEFFASCRRFCLTNTQKVL